MGIGTGAEEKGQRQKGEGEGGEEGMEQTNHHHPHRCCGRNRQHYVLRLIGIVWMMPADRVEPRRPLRRRQGTWIRERNWIIRRKQSKRRNRGMESRHSRIWYRNRQWGRQIIVNIIIYRDDLRTYLMHSAYSITSHIL